MMKKTNQNHYIYPCYSSQDSTKVIEILRNLECEGASLSCVDEISEGMSFL